MQRRPSPLDPYQEDWSEQQCYKWFARPVDRRGFRLQEGTLRCGHHRFILREHPHIPLWLLYRATEVQEWAYRPFLLIRGIGPAFEFYRVYCHPYSTRGLAVYLSQADAFPCVEWERLVCRRCARHSRARS